MDEYGYHVRGLKGRFKVSQRWGNDRQWMIRCYPCWQRWTVPKSGVIAVETWNRLVDHWLHHDFDRRERLAGRANCQRELDMVDEIKLAKRAMPKLRSLSRTI